MFKNLKLLEDTLVEFEDRMGDRVTAVDDVLIWLEKYVRSVFSSRTAAKKGDELAVPLDAAFNIAIQLFGMIDIGADGVDDRLAEELTKIKARYLGK
ncbi:MAG: hypothetical protein MUD12_09025 [Spirochaetes bacterium]|jgi:hypothetical protein|nr:hypothetical protein [Spirochaetota bacterium]